jgi:hypothetical protein
MSDIRRFMDKVSPEPNSGCWLWAGDALTSGYGVVWISDIPRQRALAHRVSYEHHKGPIPDSMFVCHKCDVPACVNPDHLFLGTNAENTNDKVAKGRQMKGQNVPSSKLTDEIVKDIRASVANGSTQKQMCDKYGIAPGTMSFVINRKTWKHVA